MRASLGQSGGGGGLPFSVGGGRLSLGTVAVILIGGWLLGINPLTLLGLLAGGETEVLRERIDALLRDLHADD